MKNRLRKILEDRIARDILTFFYRNQSSVDTVGGVSSWVQSDQKKVQSRLEKLVKAGVLEKDSMGATNGYCYTRDEKKMKIVEELIENV
ncbi:MAG: hypothetical protein U9R44_03120 [Candidatus Omnitrophota bacterium]|nr:hypothetical protein [Candidatus Omnitrophota bacterium]